jgi:hypothetical protein
MEILDMEKNTAYIGLRIPKKLKQFLEQEARREQRDLAKQVRKILLEYYFQRLQNKAEPG